MGRDFLPRQDVGLVDGAGRTSNPFYIWMQGIERLLDGGATLDEIQAAIATLQELIDNLPTSGFLPDTTSIFGRGSVLEIGTLAGGVVYLQLVNDDFAPGNTFVYSTNAAGTKGWHRLYDSLTAGEGIAITDSGYTVLGEVGTPGDLPGTGNTGEAWRVLEPAGLYAWDGAAFTLDPNATGVVGFSLEPLPDTGLGAALVKLTRDGYGRVEGTEAATTDDLAEGATNLYFTDERAQDAVGNAVDGTGDVPLSYDDGTGAISAALSSGVQASLDLADTSVQPGDDVSDLTNDAGYVDAAGAQSAVVAASITNGDTTHAPSGDAVFDALAGKAPLLRPQFTDWVGIGKAADRPLTIASDTSTLPAGTAVFLLEGDNNKERIEARSSGGGDPTFQGKASLGTLASPLALVTGESLVNLAGSGHNGVEWIVGNRAVLRARATENWSPTANGCEWVLLNTPNGSTALTPRWYLTHDGKWTPAVDNGYDIGSASVRVREVFAANGAINTSDAREKTEPRDLTEAELTAAADIARLPCIFQWLHAIDEKGEAARLHCSPTVQAVIAAMEKHGLDPFRYGFVCYDEWGETPEVKDEETGEVTQAYRPAGDRYSLRPSELAWFVMRGMAARLDAAGL